MAVTRRTLLQAALAQRRPVNLLLVTADNLGYGDMGCYGNREIATPHLDAFARQGVRFTNFYTASPTCTASRAGLLTGRHPLRYGLNYQLKPDENKGGIGLPHTERIIPQYLKPSGYATGCFGKWNLGFAPGSRPTERGFDEFLGHRSGNIDYYSHLYNAELDMYRGIEPARIEGYSVDLFAGAALDFLRRKCDQPFFCYLPFNSPHYPNKANLSPGQTLEWQAPDRFFDVYGYSPREKDEKKRYRVVVTALDDAFGRVLRALKDLRLEESTLVFFYSDNGAFMLPGRGLEVQTNRPLRGGGVTCWEGGIRVAGMARWPGQIPPGTECAQMLAAYDVLPLSLALARAKLPGGRTYDGEDPLPALAGRGSIKRQALYFEYGTQQAMRKGNWKLIRERKDAPWQLYDLERDIGETRDLAAANEPAVGAMSRQFEDWRKAVQA